MSIAVEGTAITRIVRLMSAALGTGAVIFDLLALPDLVAQFRSFEPWWIAIVLLGFFGSSLVYLALSFAGRPVVLRTLAGIMAATYLLGLVTLVPALVDGSLPPGLGAPWLFSVSVIGCAAAGVAWPRWIAICYVAMVPVLLFIDRVLASPVDVVSVAVQAAAFALLFDTIFTALAITTRRAGLALDVAADAAAAETREAAEADARSHEQARAEALVHDSVLVALLASANALPDNQQPAALQAQRAIAAIDRFDSALALPTARGGEQFCWDLQGIVTELAPDAVFGYSVATSPDIPPGVADAIFVATSEALRNSVEHAARPGAGTSRAVHATVDEHGVEVTILDDGVGFDTALVSRARLGIPVSIHARMEREPGGSAVIVSRPGVGTRVALRWVRS